MDVLILVHSACVSRVTVLLIVSAAVRRLLGSQRRLLNAISHTRWTVIGRRCMFSSFQSAKGGKRKKNTQKNPVLAPYERKAVMWHIHRCKAHMEVTDMGSERIHDS